MASVYTKKYGTNGSSDSRRLGGTWIVHSWEKKKKGNNYKTKTKNNHTFFLAKVV